VLRAGQSRTLTLERAKDAKDGADIGLFLKSSIVYAHTPPWVQVSEAALKTFRTFAALINPRSDIGLSHLSGPVGILSNFMDVSHAGMRFVLWFTILVNVNLAVFNLLPIPVLDGGQMLFATIGKLRGKALPFNFVATTQSIFVVLLLLMMAYVTIFGDFRRIIRDNRAEAQAKEAAAQKKAADPAKP
jgi:regulator of sigma E protease